VENGGVDEETGAPSSLLSLPLLYAMYLRQQSHTMEWVQLTQSSHRKLPNKHSNWTVVGARSKNVYHLKPL